MAKKLEFTLDKAEVEVSLSDPKTGTTGEYVLVEMDGRCRDKYLTNVSSRVDSGPDGKGTSVKNFEGLQSALLSLVLFEVVGSERKPVPEDTIQAWPARVQSALFDQARDMNGLGDKAEQEAGND